MTKLNNPLALPLATKKDKRSGAEDQVAAAKHFHPRLSPIFRCHEQTNSRQRESSFLESQWVLELFKGVKLEVSVPRLHSIDLSDSHKLCGRDRFTLVIPTNHC